MAETTVINKNPNVAARNTGYVANPGAAQAYQQRQAGAPRPAQLPMVRTAPQAGGGALIGGPLPRVDVKMTSNGAEVQNPHQAQPPVQARGNRHPSQQSGGLKMVQVKMGSSGPQVLSGGPEVTPKQPWSQATAQQYAFAEQSFEPPQQPEMMMPEMPEAPLLTDDQLLLCRFLVDTYITEAAETVPPEQIQLAESTIVAIDETMIARNAAEALAAIEQVAPPVAPQAAARPAMPRQVPPRAVIASRGSVQMKGTAPRRVPRPAPPQAPQAMAPQAETPPAPTSIPTRAPVVIDVIGPDEPTAA